MSNIYNIDTAVQTSITRQSKQRHSNSKTTIRFLMYSYKTTHLHAHTHKRTRTHTHSRFYLTYLSGSIQVRLGLQRRTSCLWNCCCRFSTNQTPTLCPTTSIKAINIYNHTNYRLKLINSKNKYSCLSFSAAR